MIYPTHTTWERLYRAVSDLAAGTESVQDRLCSACLALSPLKVEEFPEELQADFEALMREMSEREPSGNEGRFKATANFLSNEIAEQMAQKIVDMYDTVARKFCVPDQPL